MSAIETLGGERLGVEYELEVAPGEAGAGAEGITDRQSRLRSASATAKVGSRSTSGVSQFSRPASTSVAASMELNDLVTEPMWRSPIAAQSRHSGSSSDAAHDRLALCHEDEYLWRPRQRHRAAPPRRMARHPRHRP